MEPIKILYDELLNVICSNVNRFPEDELSIFSYAKGNQYDNQVLCVGRSVNGWNCYNKFGLEDSKTEILKNVAVEDLYWVKEKWGSKEKYNTKKSAFWRLNGYLSNYFYGDQELNFNKISWTNLYKISKSKKGNPSRKLQVIQFDLAKKILVEEVKILKPKYIFFNTSLFWSKPFISNDNNITFETFSHNKYVEAKGNFYGSIFIVGQHPQGKPDEEQAHEILSYIK